MVQDISVCPLCTYIGMFVDADCVPGYCKRGLVSFISLKTNTQSHGWHEVIPEHWVMKPRVTMVAILYMMPQNWDDKVFGSRRDWAISCLPQFYRWENHVWIRQWFPLHFHKELVLSAKTHVFWFSVSLSALQVYYHHDHDRDHHCHCLHHCK